MSSSRDEGLGTPSGCSGDGEAPDAFEDASARDAREPRAEPPPLTPEEADAPHVVSLLEQFHGPWRARGRAPDDGLGFVKVRTARMMAPLRARNDALSFPSGGAPRSARARVPLYVYEYARVHDVRYMYFLNLRVHVKQLRTCIRSYFYNFLHYVLLRKMCLLLAGRCVRAALKSSSVQILHAHARTQRVSTRKRRSL